jgi:tetratricopeptide (TPR) repeat protein
MDVAALHVASALGQRFDTEPLVGVLSDYDPLRLLGTGLVLRAGDGFRFSHALVRDAVLRSLAAERVRELHLRLAVWYQARDPVLYAEHLDQAGSDQAPGALLAAAHTRFERQRHAQGLELLDRALALCPTLQMRSRLLCARGEAMLALTRAEDAVAAYEEALDAAATATQKANAATGLAAALRVTDRIDRALSLLDEAQVIAEAHDDAELLTSIHYLRGSLYFPRGRVDDCRAEHRLALRHAERCGSAQDRARALSGLGDAEYARGNMRSAFERFRECLELCDAHGFGRIEAANRFMRATTRIYFNESEGALADALSSADVGRRVRHHRAEVVSRLTAGMGPTSTAADFALRWHCRTDL